jgi:23S rRNA (adenine2503-C2)-methyltransferase
MPVLSASEGPISFFGISSDELDAHLCSWGLPRFRGRQLRDWVYNKLIADPQRMSNLSKSDRQRLGERLSFAASSVDSRQSSSDGTQKLLMTWPNGANAETVMIPDGPRRTACISSQVGCPVGCRFCASGINGVKGNLTSAQIVEQVFRLNQIMQPATEGNGDAASFRSGCDKDAASLLRTALSGIPLRSADPARAAADDRGARITNIVFMGMGEPLANYANVMAAVRILHDPQCFNIGARKITISTVGVPAKMRELAGEKLPINLAISLHAPTEPLRKQLIPWAEHFALEDILSAARFYFEKTGREVTLEYILLSGVNDQPEHARQLVKLCRTLRANVNLIRYNEVAGLPYLRPKSQDVVRFQEILRESGVNAHVRKSRGRDISAACGQLRREQIEQKPSPDASLRSAVGLPLPVVE